MRRTFLIAIVSFALSSFSLGAAAQKLKIESQGQAEQDRLRIDAHFLHQGERVPVGAHEDVLSVVQHPPFLLDRTGAT